MGISVDVCEYVYQIHASMGIFLYRNVYMNTNIFVQVTRTWAYLHVYMRTYLCTNGNVIWTNALLECTNEYLYMYKWACLYEQMVIFICTNDYLYMYKWVSLYVQVSICTCTNAHTYMYRTAFIFVQMSTRVQITRPVTNEASGRCCVINDMQNAFSCFVWHIFCDICVIDSVYKYKILTNTHTVYVCANAKLCVISKSCYMCAHSILCLACDAVSSKTV